MAAWLLFVGAIVVALVLVRDRAYKEPSAFTSPDSHGGGIGGAL